MKRGKKRKKRARENRVSLKRRAVNSSQDRGLLGMAWQIESEEKYVRAVREFQQQEDILLVGISFNGRFYTSSKKDRLYLILMIVSGKLDSHPVTQVDATIRDLGGVRCEDPALIQLLLNDAWKEHRKQLKKG